MISNSTKKNRRKKVFANQNRSRLSLRCIDPRVDFWLLSILTTPSKSEHIEISGKNNAIRILRHLSSFMGTKTYESVIQPRY